MVLVRKQEKGFFFYVDGRQSTDSMIQQLSVDHDRIVNDGTIIELSFADIILD